MIEGPSVQNSVVPRTLCLALTSSLFLLGTACGENPRSQTAETKAISGKRPAAEYEETKALITASGWLRLFEFEAKKSGQSQAQQDETANRVREYSNLLTVILKSQPSLKIFFHTPERVSDELGDQSEYARWAPQVEAWKKNGFNIDFLRMDPKNFPGVDQEDLEEDQWTRDYGSFSVINDGDVSEIARKGRGQYVNTVVADNLKRDIEIVDSYYEGGQFMATSTGVCASSSSGYSINAENFKSFDNTSQQINYQENLIFKSLGCRRILKMPGLPNEGTGHIDLFAKFMDDRTVLLADYTDDDVLLEGVSTEVDNICDAKSIENKDWSSCASSGNWRDVIINQGSVLRIKSENELRDFVAKNQGITEFEYAHGQLHEHLEKALVLFQSEGFDVVRVTNPTPTIRLGVMIYRDSSGAIVHRNAELNFTHRSYTNSLVSNGYLYLPTYQTSPALNAAASSTYEALGLKVQNIDMSETIKTGGAVHCLTKDLH